MKSSRPPQPEARRMPSLHRRLIVLSLLATSCPSKQDSATPEKLFYGDQCSGAEECDKGLECLAVAEYYKTAGECVSARDICTVRCLTGGDCSGFGAGCYENCDGVKVCSDAAP